MIIQLPFSELQDYISKQFKQNVDFHCVNEKTISIGTVVRMPFITKHMNLNLSVERVEGQNITLSYSNGIGIDLMVKGTLKFINSMFPEYGEIVEDRTANSFIVHLGKVKQLESVFEHVRLRDVRFEGQGLLLDASLL